MKSRYFLPLEEKEQIFVVELLKSGVEYSKAVKVAGIVAAGKADDALADEERQLVRVACREWLRRRKRMTLIDEMLSNPH